jgi:hypothetical protein
MNNKSDGEQMSNNKFIRLTKTLSFLLLVSVIMFVTVASASEDIHDRDASANINIHNGDASANTNKHDRDISATETNGYGFRANKIGSLSGSQYGYKEGYNVGLEDCLKHRQKGVLTKITDPVINNNWTKNYRGGYKEGFKKGYLNGYNDARFKCLKK